MLLRMLQDIKEVTKDVRKIIAEQLGTEEDKVRLVCTSDAQLFQQGDPEASMAQTSYV